MNILPKKRWHVRTRENIARVRRDEAVAAENERTRKARSQKAETEARINALREKTRARYDGQNEIMQNDEFQSAKEKLHHVNFFADLEEGKIDHHKPNAEYEAETKAEKEKYEQQIGYLTYLGQSIHPSKDNSNWYNEVPRRLTDKEPEKEIQESKKMIVDPMTDIKQYINIMSSCRSKTRTNIADEDTGEKKFHKQKRSREKLKKRKLDRFECSQLRKFNAHKMSIEKLRDERLSREKTEKLRTDALLAKLSGESIPFIKKEEPKNVIRQKYNSQFCPEIARQNATTTIRQR